MCDMVPKIEENINLVREKFMRHLSDNGYIKELSKSFSALENNLERVNFVEELLKTHKFTIKYYKDEKNNTLAVQYREQGNLMYKKKKLKEALEFYTKSIANAENQSIELGKAYGNRSAVLYELNLHQQCLIDIKRAFESNYPEELQSKLITRTKNCKITKTNVKHHEEIPKIIDKNPQIENTSTSIQIRDTPELGRHIIANREIKPGEILAIEKPFAVILVDEFYNHCHHCITLSYNLIPCENCTQALYCDETCKKTALESYHKYECPILATSRIFKFEKLRMLPLRVAFLVCESSQQSAINNLITNTGRRAVSDLFERATIAALIYNLIENHSNVISKRDILKEMLLLHMQTGPSNFHGIGELSPNPDGIFEVKEIASGAFAFHSLLNHSCVSNVTRFSYGDTMVLRAMSTIAKGEQCFDNYGYHFAKTAKDERQQQLKKQYYFDCNCVACEENWPFFTELPSFGPEFELGHDLFLKLAAADLGTAKEILNGAISWLHEQRFSQQPGKHFFFVQEILKQCFAIFGNKQILV